MNPNTFYAVNTVYVMKQGTHIQFQLVTMCYEGIKNHCQLLHAFSKNMLVSNIRQHSFTSTLFVTKRGTKLFLLLTGLTGAFLVKSRKQTNNNKKKKRKRNLQVTLYMLAKTEGGPAGCRSSLILPQSIPIQIARPSLQPTGWASAPESDHAADHCGPPSVRPPVLVILLVQHGGYLFLHQPQLVAQVVVGFHEVLDLGFRGGQRIFHLHVFLHSNGAVW